MIAINRLNQHRPASWNLPSGSYDDVPNFVEPRPCGMPAVAIGCAGVALLIVAAVIVGWMR